MCVLGFALVHCQFIDVLAVDSDADVVCSGNAKTWHPKRTLDDSHTCVLTNCCNQICLVIHMGSKVVQASTENLRRQQFFNDPCSSHPLNDAHDDRRAIACVAQGACVR